MTRLEANGLDPSAIVVHPNDWETIELSLATTNAVEHLALPYDAAARRLYGVPIAVCVSEAPGTAHVLADLSVILNTDDQGTVQWSENAGAETFARNQIVARCEMRAATSVPRPLGVVKATVGGGS